MEKRNDFNKRTPCRAELYGDKFCDCDSCISVKRAATKRGSICDVETLSEKHNELKHK